MKSALFYGPGDVRIEDVPVPTPGPGEVLVQIRVGLTCGTDLKTYRRGHPTLIDRLPSPFGHEFAGVVAEVGPGVERFRPGMRVVAVNSAPCNRCFFCIHGRQSLCENLRFLNGAYAEYIVVPSDIVRVNMYPIPDDLPFEEAALLEPLACAVHGIAESPIRIEDTVVVNGAGPMGLMLVRLAALRGAYVISTDRSSARLELARELGASATVNVTEVPDVVEAVKALTKGGRGADVAIEAVGLPSTWEATIAMTRKGGTAVLFGGTPSGSRVSVDATFVHYGEVTLKGVFHHTPYYVQVAYDLLRRRRIGAEKLISGRRPLEQLVTVLELLSQQQGIKYAIVPSA